MLGTRHYQNVQFDLWQGLASEFLVDFHFCSSDPDPLLNQENNIDFWKKVQNNLKENSLANSFHISLTVREGSFTENNFRDFLKYIGEKISDSCDSPLHRLTLIVEDEGPFESIQTIFLTEFNWILGS